MLSWNSWLGIEQLCIIACWIIASIQIFSTWITAILLLTTMVTSNCLSPDGNGAPSGGGAEGDACPEIELPFHYDERITTYGETNIEVNVNLFGAKNDPELFDDVINNPQAWYSSPPTNEEDSQACGSLDHRGARPNSSDILGTNLTCPWTYRCDYNPRRFPAYILHAKCGSSPSPRYNCESVFYPIPVLSSDTGCNHLSEDASWKLAYEVVAVGCTARHNDLRFLRRRNSNFLTPSKNARYGTTHELVYWSPSSTATSILILLLHYYMYTLCTKMHYNYITITSSLKCHYMQYA